MKSKISRREFLAAGSKGLVTATAIPFFLKCSPGKILAGPENNGASQLDYYSHFGVNEQIINSVMGSALSKGGDYCDVYFEHSISNSISLEDHAVNEASSTVDFGVGIRVLKGDQTGYSFTEEITPEAMKQAALTAANIANSASKTVQSIGLKLHKTPNYYPIGKSWEEVSIDQKIPSLLSVSDYVFSLDPRIIRAGVRFSNSTSYIMVATSDGKIAHDYRPMGRISVSCTAEDNGRREQNWESLSGRYGFEYFTTERINELAQRSVNKTMELFNAVQPKAGEMEVVLAAGHSGILLHEAIGHGMEADFNRKGISIFADKLNKPVAEKFVNIVDDGTNENVRGSLNVDDEANDTEKTFLVEDGILRSYLHDHISSQYYKVKPTGNGRRESFRHAPMPRMRNTYMLPGPHNKGEIIASVKNGLYAESFANGEVWIGAGDFTFYVKTGYLIENGKLTKPVKDMNIIGNGPEVLKNIVMVGDDVAMAHSGGTCGKNSQWAPVSMGLPTIKVSSITVGGTS